ncbi:uncharacterized protein LOC127289052 [Leptopilina boulardi]|uniref:uncharacterized protein LOC127289052 n=1 Tax=Leptopilina boulardi TaxID=63433 RepID=UPI0021F5BE10|nr:uncharacterized protein LOC127289052 [Leptopilina boulardi]
MTTINIYSSLVTLTIYHLCFPVLILGAPYALRKSDDRFEVTIQDLHRMCESNGLNLYESVIYFQMPYMNVSTTAMKRIYEGISSVKSLDSLEHLTEQYCRQNPDIKKYLQYVTELVKTCMDESHRLQNYKMKKILDVFITRVCADIQYDAVQKYDTNCFKSERTISKMVDCYGSSEPRGVVFRNDYMLPIQNNPTHKECTGVFKYYDCVVFSVQRCEKSTKQFIESHFESKKSFAGCENNVNYV